LYDRKSRIFAGFDARQVLFERLVDMEYGMSPRGTMGSADHPADVAHHPVARATR
jgi:hypothetical protein